MGLGGAIHALGGALQGTGLHKFDTGLALPQRSTIRQGLIDRLSAELLKANGGYLNAIVPLPRLFRGEGDEDGLAIIARALQGQAPAIGIALGRKTYEATDSEANVSEGELAIGVYFISQHGRDLVDGRLSPDVVAQGAIDADPGIEVVMEHVEELLLGQELNIHGASEIRPVTEDEVATFDDVTIWEQTYAIHVARAIDPARKSTRFVTSIQGDHKVAGITDPGPLSPLVRTVAELEEG